MPSFIPHRIKAFTLIELLVTIAIMAVLVALSLSGIRLVQEQAKAARCGHNLRQLGQGLLLYAQEHDNRLPSAWYQNNAGYLWYFSPEFDPYLGPQGEKRLALGMCPSWDGTKRKGIPGSLIYPPNTYDSYTLCYPLPYSFNTTPSLSQYSHAASTLLLCDSKPNTPTYNAYAILPMTRTAARFLTQNGDATSRPTGFRHNRKMNALFADGHGAALAPQDITDEMLNP